MKTRKSIYDDPAVVKNLLATLKALEERDSSVLIVHQQAAEGKFAILRPDSVDFPFINVRAGLKKRQVSKQRDQQQNPQVSLKIVSTK